MNINYLYLGLTIVLAVAIGNMLSEGIMSFSDSIQELRERQAQA